MMLYKHMARGKLHGAYFTYARKNRSASAQDATGIHEQMPTFCSFPAILITLSPTSKRSTTQLIACSQSVNQATK